ncbi:ABC transporter, substrate binding protein (sugar) [Stappia aggregata IAM 12614]|uniref:ABC transporter, substrate binding protein (Sugar) n=1 Tax=Roseibium aggregatum (strain ATCC 25650 / DSM 13394 / JCM 20685 / NBRC 16684 / NCIMB 2208 / IAM 12614 / B1) TaxID=384765 RepID=A0P090_ROSAI|nr:extracellular solute-binding protein [Roseibium aggregatum]EAV41498.1 ABC transporter, substrate binding protein (sugar) [Stappia aggregata IAM 12614] [Roseibium aggregatum IAM 12614]
MKYLKTLLAAGAMSLASLPAFAQQDITWWDFLSGGDGVRMKALIERFNEEHPDIKINATTLEWGVPYYTKVRTSVAVGQGPDVMTYHLSRMPLGLEENVLDVISDDDLATAGLSKDDFFPAAIAAASDAEGNLHAVPFDIHSIVLYINKSYFKGSRFLDDEGNLTGIESLADFEEALALAKENGSETPVSYATADDGSTYRVFFTLLKQQGGELITDGEVLAGDNLDKAANAIEIMTNWHKQGWQPEQAEYPASVALFTSGKSAFHMNGVWEVPTLVDMSSKGTLGFDWGAVQIPTLLGTTATWADSHAFAIPTGKEMSPEKRAAVMTAIGWMEKNSISWASAGHIPAYKPVATSDEFGQMEPNATYSSLADTAVYDPRSPIAGVASPVYDATINIISPAMHGYLEPAQAAQQVKDELQSKIQ